MEGIDLAQGLLLCRIDDCARVQLGVDLSDTTCRYLLGHIGHVVPVDATPHREVRNRYTLFSRQGNELAHTAHRIGHRPLLEHLGSSWSTRWHRIDDYTSADGRHGRVGSQDPAITPSCDDWRFEPQSNGAFSSRSDITLLRRDPGKDLISLLLAPGDQPPPTEEELLGFAFLLMIAGTETTTNLLSSSCVLLDRHRELRQRLIEDPGAIPKAVEEFLRYETPVQGLMRTTTRDVEILGRGIPAGSRVHMLFGSANRDERVFAHPESIDIDRSPNNHLSFGFGIHFCMGAGLARLEGRVAFEELLARMPDYSIDHGALERLRGYSNRGYTRVPMSFKAGMRAEPARLSG